MKTEGSKMDLRVLLSKELSDLHLSLEKLSQLYKNMPADDLIKKQFSEDALKQKSAWYACLVNTNIDVLLIPEYLESKLSRNILIKKETEQFFKSVENFRLHTVQSESSVYECILYSEEAKAKSGFDLFSSQAPETASCPESLNKLFALWENEYSTFSAFEKFVFTSYDWHRSNAYSFSGQRQFVLRINYMLWKLYGPIALKIHIENFLFESWNNEQPEPKIAIAKLIGFLGDEVNRIAAELRESYRSQIGYGALKGIQRAVSMHLFESGFNTGLKNTVFQNAWEILSLIQKKGFIAYHDFSSASDIEKHRVLLNELLEKGLLLASRDNDEVCIYLNTSLSNRNGRLFAYQNVSALKSEAGIDDFIKQSPARPEKAVETIGIATEPVAAEPQKEKRKKAFFG